MNYKSEIHPSLFTYGEKGKKLDICGRGGNTLQIHQASVPARHEGRNNIFHVFKAGETPACTLYMYLWEGLIGRLLRGHICRKEVPFLFFFFYLSGVSLSQGGDAYKATLVLCQGGGEGLAKKREKKRGKKKPCPSFSTLTPHTIAAGVILHAC